MPRIAWVMKLKPGEEAAYKAKHDRIWPEMLDLMKTHKVGNFSIFSDGLMLFAYQERDDDAPPPGPHPEVLLRWWASMAQHMETNADGSPWQRPLHEVFHAN